MSDFGVWVDFNSVSEEGEIVTLRRYAKMPLHVGSTVIVGDLEGNTCPARVLRMEEELVYLDADMARFVPAL